MLIKTAFVQNLSQNSTYDPELLKQTFLDRTTGLTLGCFRTHKFQSATDCDPNHSVLTDSVIKRPHIQVT